MTTKILVTGAKGQLGQTIKENYEFDPSFDIVFASKKELDITNNEEINTFLEAHKFNYCINCAAYTHVEQAETNPDLAFMVNADGVKKLAQQCKAHNVVLVHISTDYVFDGKKQSPYTEDDIPNPINQYGKSKLLGEKYIQEDLEKYFIIRTSWLYSKFGKNFLKTIIQKIESDDKMQITISEKGTPTSCSDVAEFIFCLIKNKTPLFGVYHFSALGETTWYDYAMQICRHFKNYDCNKIEPVKTFNFKANRPSNSILDNTKASRIINKKFSWQKSVDKTVKSLIEEL